MKYLLIMSAYWADEFQCEEYCIKDTREEAEEDIETCLTQETSFGTNEGFEEGELSKNDFEIKEISDEQAAFLEKTLGNRFGTGVL